MCDSRERIYYIESEMCVGRQGAVLWKVLFVALYISYLHRYVYFIIYLG
jgi:hypothetical protein